MDAFDIDKDNLGNDEGLRNYCDAISVRVSIARMLSDGRPSTSDLKSIIQSCREIVDACKDIDEVQKKIDGPTCLRSAVEIDCNLLEHSWRGRGLRLWCYEC